MFSIAIRNLLQEKTRLFISAGGVAFSIILMLVMMGIYEGSVFQFTRYIEENPTDMVIAQEGIIDFFHGVSLISLPEVEELQKQEGVKDIVPMIGQRGTLDWEDRKYHVFVVSLKPESPLGAPWEVTGGTQEIKEGDMILSETLAKKIGKEVGDEIFLLDSNFRITGLARDASSFNINYAWITFDEARRVSKLPEMVNFAFATLDAPGEAENFAKRIEAEHGGWSVVDKETFIRNNRGELEESYLPIIRAIMVIAVLIGIAVVGLTIYTATVEKAREYGILKAIGVSNRQLYIMVGAQAVITVLAGLIIGIVASFLIAAGIQDWVNLPPKIDMRQVVWVVGAGMFMAIIASFLPLRRLVKIDPAQVFKS